MLRPGTRSSAPARRNSARWERRSSARPPGRSTAAPLTSARRRTMTRNGGTEHDNPYRPTESKYKGGAHDMFVTYDLDERTRGGDTTTYPKVKRVYIAGEVKDWIAGAVRKRTGREVPGVRIEYEQSRKRYRQI